MTSQADSDYSVKYSSSSARPGADDGNINIVLPGGASAASQPKASRDQEDSVVITPDPSGIVIKTRLMKEKRNLSSFGDDNNVDDAYVPPSLSNIYAESQTNIADVTNSADNEGVKKDDTKVFLNVCTHPLIAVPGQKKGLDEQTGKEIDGWRLPMSMGELRPCYDKNGNAAIVADCVVNPKVVREMKSDPNHLQFVCDLVVQCASRKFGQTWFGGHDLDRRFKLPRMKYAGYVDETTGLPILPEDPGSTNEATAQKVAVAKQRVKGHGGKSAIIEEVASEERRVAARPKIEVVHSDQNEPKRPNSTKFCIELFIDDRGHSCMPLFDFLSVAAEEEGVAPKGQPSDTLRNLIRYPKLKPCDESETLHDSQLLTTPMPFGFAVVGSSVSNEIESINTGANLDRWSIVAKSTIGSSTPAIELSAFLLVFTSNNGKTECILPFPIDTHRSTSIFDQSTGAIEVRMPLLQNAFNVEDGPDPGTRPWELQNALGGGKSSATTKDKTVDLSCSAETDDTSRDMLGSYFHDTGSAEEVDDDIQSLPEDAFHSQDVLSRHLLQQQEEERLKRSAERSHGRDEADVEYINVDDFRKPQSDSFGREDVRDLVLGLA